MCGILHKLSACCRDFEMFHFILYCHLTGSSSSPDEDRLLKRLFHPDYQEHNLMTTPVLNNNESINVDVALEIRKLIALVISKDHFAHKVVL